MTYNSWLKRLQRHSIDALQKVIAALSPEIYVLVRDIRVLIRYLKLKFNNLL